MSTVASGAAFRPLSGEGWREPWPMYAALRAIPIPDDVVARLFHAATLLREHRGDGHVAAIVGAGHAARYYQDVMNRWWAVRARVPGETYLEIRLEDLVASPRSVLERLCAFWGLPWDDALLSLDLSRSRPGRWRRDLPPASHEAVMEAVRPTMEAYGYDA